MNINDKLIEGEKAKKEVELTDANWKFIKHLRLGATIQEAYKLAGYESESLNAPYSLYHQIKRKMQEIIEADGFDKLRLARDFEKVLSLPLTEAKQEVTMTEWLKIRRLAHTIMSDNEQKVPNQSFSLIILETGHAPNTVDVKSTQAKVIDAEVIEASEPSKPSEPS